MNLGGLENIDLIMDAINGMSLGSMLNGLLNFGYSDADNSSWSPSNPVATTASDETLNKTSYATTASEVTDYTINWSNRYSGNANSTYTSTASSLALESLVEKVEVNLFNRNGYQPYLSDMPWVDQTLTEATDASLLSVKVELSKDGYNELMIFVYKMLFGLLQTAVDTNAGGSAYFALNSDANIERHWSDNRKYTISNLLRELDYIDSLSGSAHEKTVKKVELLEPYAESLPYAMAVWLIEDMLPQSLDQTIIDILMRASIGANAIGDVTLLLAGILPPFASYDESVPNPSLNVYIDLARESHDLYGIDREIAPGIQAIELMVNAETSTVETTNINGVDTPSRGGKWLMQGSNVGQIWFDANESDPEGSSWHSSIPVSYTHLTLPTT